MAKPRWGPSIAAASKWRYNVADIVCVARYGATPRCTPAGIIELDDTGRIAYSLGHNATCAVLSRMPAAPEKMLAFVDAEGRPSTPEPQCKCYVVRVIPDCDVQVAGFHGAALGACFIARETQLSQNSKEKRLAELGLWNHESGVFESKRIKDLRDRVHHDEMEGKGGGHVAEDR